MPCSLRPGFADFRRLLVESGDSVQGIGLERRIGADRLTVLGSDYKSVQSIGAQLPLQHAGHDASVEHYDPAGPWAFADAGQAERHAGLMAQAEEARREQWLGHGTARTLRTGTWFRLTRAPDAPGQSSPSPELLLTRLHHLGVNNLPVDLRESVQAQLGDAPGWEDDELPGEPAARTCRPAPGRWATPTSSRPWTAAAPGARCWPMTPGPGSTRGPPRPATRPRSWWARTGRPVLPDRRSCIATRWGGSR